MKSYLQARVVYAALVFAFILICITLLPTERALAQTASGPTIFDVRRSLPLEPDEPVTKDFYINAGPESGLKKGIYVNVVRAVPVHDPIKNQQQATIKIPVGKVQVIDVQRGITVARLQSELGDDERPTLEFEGVMIGDYVDLGSATMDVPKKSKAKAKHQSASTTASATEEVAVTLTPVVLPPETPVPSPASRAAASVTAPVPVASPAQPAGSTSSQNGSTAAPPAPEVPKSTKPATSADASEPSFQSNLDT